MRNTGVKRITFEPGELPMLDAWFGDTEVRSCALRLSTGFSYGEGKA
jgi:hypothetical protein